MDVGVGFITEHTSCSSDVFVSIFHPLEHVEARTTNGIYGFK